MSGKLFTKVVELAFTVFHSSSVNTMLVTSTISLKTGGLNMDHLSQQMNGNRPREELHSDALDF